jgi:hypothetical protein
MSWDAGIGNKDPEAFDRLAGHLDRMGSLFSSFIDEKIQLARDAGPDSAWHLEDRPDRGHR